MLMALALLAAIDAVPPPVVEVTLTGGRGTPVSAAPRTLSDVARDRREGRKAVGGFSAVETTLPRSPVTPIAPLEPEGEATRAEPEVVYEPPPGSLPEYDSVWYGGYPTYGGYPAYGGSPGCGGLRPRFPSHVAIPRPGPRHAYRPSSTPSRQPFSYRHGISAGASGFGRRGTRIFAVTRP